MTQDSPIGVTGSTGAIGGGVASRLAEAGLAQRLAIAPKTVGNHISAIFLKLGVASRAQAIVLAREAGLGLRP